jgi:YidC/Oxa1 family membrane protein insertase
MDFLTNPFIAVLLFLYQILAQNYVLALIVFTIVVQVITYPLTRASMQSSKKMQELSPRLNKLKEKYKDDREKMAQAQMQLYREAGVNPMAGCLPLIIQMPILFGLYGAISHTLSGTPLQVLDLHHRLSIAPDLKALFPLQNQFLWLNLGLPDTTPVLPILVVATTWLRTKLTTPTPTDPKDPSAAISRQMLIMMPLMTGLISVSFASGLSIYWVASNMVGVAQYLMMGRVNLRTLSAKPMTVPAGVVDDDKELAPVAEKPKRALSAAPARPTSKPSNGSSANTPKGRPRITPKKRATSKR